MTGRSGRSDIDSPAGGTSLLIFFGSRQALGAGARHDALRGMFTRAHALRGSTGGPINSNDINDDEIVAAEETAPCTS